MSHVPHARSPTVERRAYGRPARGLSSRYGSFSRVQKARTAAFSTAVRSLAGIAPQQLTTNDPGGSRTRDLRIKREPGLLTPSQHEYLEVTARFRVTAGAVILHTSAFLPALECLGCNRGACSMRPPSPFGRERPTSHFETRRQLRCDDETFSELQRMRMRSCQRVCNRRQAARRFRIERMTRTPSVSSPSACLHTFR